MNFLEERYELACERIAEIVITQEIPQNYKDYFKKTAQFLLLMRDTKEKIQRGFLKTASLDELRSMNQALYEDILDNNYKTSYANPSVCVEKFGLQLGRMLSFLYAEIRCMISYVFEDMLEEQVIRMELFLEVYNAFEYACAEGGEAPNENEIKETLYWFVSDYSEPAAEWRVRTQVDAECDFATKIVMNSDLKDVRYLYQYGERSPAYNFLL